MDQRFHLSVSIAAVLALTVSASGQTSSVPSKDSQVAAAATYELENSGHGAYQARNDAQQLRVEFTAQEAQFQYPNASGGLRLIGYGYGQYFRAPQAATLTRTGNRLEYYRGDVTEWYVNQADGLEQGFTFEGRPAGAGDGEPLVIALAVTGGFKPVLAPGGGEVFLRSQTGEELRYGGLHTWDARGREIASRMEVRNQEIRLIVDDRDAVYPLVVDPSVQTLMVAPPSPATLGTIVSLTATVLPTTPVNVTFYDGTTVLGVAATAAGTAVFNTMLLPTSVNCLGSPCVHTFSARVDGDATLISTTTPYRVISNPATTFGPLASFNVGTYASAMAVGAFNLKNNFFADLAVSNLGGNNVTSLRGNDNGNFVQPASSPFAAGASPRAIAVGDFNTDGFPDLAVVDFMSVSILPGKGNATFDAPLIPPLKPGLFPQGIAAGDFNSDGFVDLAVTNNGDGSVSIFLGKGDGTFQAPMNFLVGLGPAGIAVGDFDGDHIPDLAIVDDISQSVTIWHGNNDGTFVNNTTPVFVGVVSNGGETIAAADFNLDGKLDIAVSSNSPGTGGVSVLLGNGNRTFGLPIFIPTGDYPDAIAVGDFNGDGKPDITVANAYDSDISIVLGNGTLGTFQPAVNYPVGSLPSAIAVGEFNGDGLTDLVTADFDSDVTLLLGQDWLISASASSTPQSAQINTAFAPLVAIVTDALNKNKPVANVPVTFTAPTTGPSGTFANRSTTAIVATDSNGNATAPQFLANGIAGTYMVTAQVGFGAITSFTLKNTAGLGVQLKIVSSPSPASATVNTLFTGPFKVMLTDNSGNPLSGMGVSFSAPPSGASASFGTPTPVGAITGADGTVSVPIMANTIAGTYQVTANVAGFASVNITLTNVAGPATQIAPLIQAQSTTVNTQFTSPLIVQVQDQYGNPVGSGIKPYVITFSLLPAGGPQSATFIPGGATSDMENTNAAGIATSKMLMANGTAGTYTVLASSTPSLPGNALFNLTNLPIPTQGIPTAMAIIQGTPQNAAIGSQFGLPLVVTVTDTNNIQVSGVTVTFTVQPSASGAGGTFSGMNVMVGPGGSATAITAHTTTPAPGNFAAVTFTANSILGSYTVTASVPGLTPVVFNLTNSSGIVLPSNVTVSLGSSTVFPVTLTSPSPGGVSITLSGDNVASLNAGGVYIPAGATSPASQPSVIGKNIGVSTITAKSYGYPDTTATVTVNATVSFWVSSYSITGTGIRTFMLYLSGAPSSALTVNLSSDNPSVVTVPSSVTFGPGATSVSFQVNGGGAGGGATTLIHASALPFIPDATMTVTDN